MSKYYIIAGEASGDMHAANLMLALQKEDTTAEFRAWGGDKMQATGTHLVKHYKDLAFMGFVEVLFNLRTILKNIAFCKEDIIQYQPDVLILVDYPGFNLRIAKWAHQAGMRVVYYISPQVWAWKKGRVHQIKQYVDQMLVILPFEPAFYQSYNYEVSYVGHPLLDALAKEHTPTDFLSRYGLEQKPIIALLPGSRRQEIRKILPIMLSQINQFKEYEFVIAAAPAIEDSFYHAIIDNTHIKLIKNDTHALLRHAHAALVTSGTATLETALLNVPQVVCYKGNSLSFAIAKRLVDISFISLVNLIMDKEVVKELIQKEFNPIQLQKELAAILSGNQRKIILQDYRLLKEKLGGIGASVRAAKEIANFLYLKPLVSESFLK